MPQRRDLDELYKGFLDNSLGRESLATFLHNIQDSENEERISELMEATWDEMYAEKAPVTKINHNRRIFKWVGAAAAAVILIVSGILIFNGRNNRQIVPELITTSTDIEAPISNKAMVTLADGRKIFLDSIDKGVFANEAGIELMKTADGTLSYQSSSSNIRNSELKYNTLFNPRGSKVLSLTLSDGTKVWLNSESTLRYPAAFASDKREIEVIGEAYFEVAKVERPLKNNIKQKVPFYVRSGELVTEVVGTEFNVNAYPDESGIRVTLFEGAVNVKFDRSTTNDIESVSLKPGQTAFSDNSLTKGIQIINKADLVQTIAWKNGWFHFESADLKTILKEYARWYDIEIIYEGRVNTERYFSIMSRSTSLTNVLKSLQANDIKFRLVGKKLYVKEA